MLYWQGWRIPDISTHLNYAHGQIYKWRLDYDWDAVAVVRRMEESIDARLSMLISREKKRDVDFKEIDTLSKALERMARIRNYDKTGRDEDLNPAVLAMNETNKKRKGKANPKKNAITDDHIEKLRDAFSDELFGYQKEWLKQKELARRTRDILKSRQIGATYYFAREAFMDAVETGDNQVFLSASKAQAHVFRQYIIQFARDVAGVDLRGDPIVMGNGAQLHFLGTNSRTAQSYHGHLYVDEYFWIPKFNELNKVASGIAMHKKWRKTYFSTPSSINHEAYPFWTGDRINRGKKKKDHIHIDVSHKVLQSGRMCEDLQWRHIVTVEDATEAGCDLFDIDELKIEYSKEEYDNLLMCEFIDDTQSVFPLAMLQSCLVDSWVVWTDFRPFAPRPIGDRPVWIGYDPSRMRDGAAVIVVAPPQVDGGKYRVLAKLTWHKMPFPEQAKLLQKICGAYRVEHLEIDCSGPGGIGVYDLVSEYYPSAKRVAYTPQVKASLIAKALNIIGNGRLEYDAGWHDLTMALMSIHQTMTHAGGQITFQSGRGKEIGHGDLAWALMHALDKSEITAGGGSGGRSIMEIF